MSSIAVLAPPPDPDREPSAAELAAIEAEWPLIEIELALLDAEIAALSGRVSPLDRQRLTRARRRVAWEAAAVADSGRQASPGQVA